MDKIIFGFFIIYVLLLFTITWVTSKKANNKTYFTGNRRSPWFVVAYGMIGASLSGVTFMSVPGDVATTQFTYYGVVLGYILGYIAIIYILLPLYYKLHLTSIYQYLGDRFDKNAHKTGSLFFIISRLFGSALRMYLVIFVMQIFLFDKWNVPVWLTATVIILIITLYTFKGGVKTVVWADMLQTTFMLAALVITIVVISKNLNLSLEGIWQALDAKGYTKVFEMDWRAHNYFLKQIFGGMFITIAMTGLDQDMMQKNLTCKSLHDAQKNMFSFTAILVVINALFLLMGGMILLYAQNNGIDISGIPTDRIYPEIAFNYLGAFAAIIFVIGVFSAGFSSADGTFTALTTSVCYDLLEIEKRYSSEKKQLYTRYLVHLIIAILFLTIIIVFANYHNDALIRILFNIASLTYGPLLGLFAFGLFTQRNMKSKYVIPIVSIMVPTCCFFLSKFSTVLLNGYKFGFEMLILNGLLVFFFLLMFSKSIHK
ncbi:MAG: sodium:solute symporter [Bacteroidales bacterium]|jgi:SSS family transporter|nr:sodium:solute symporter [Bacteroidales bacterium]